MLDDLRNSAAQSFEEESPPGEVNNTQVVREGENFLGMTAPQRFVLALLLFFMVCVLGAFILMLTDKVMLPIF
jgi:hypothetical protein